MEKRAQKRKRKSSPSPSAQLLSRAVNSLEKYRKEKESSPESKHKEFAAMVQKELDTMAPNNAIIARKLINDVLFLENCGTLNPETSIVN